MTAAPRPDGGVRRGSEGFRGVQRGSEGLGGAQRVVTAHQHLQLLTAAATGRSKQGCAGGGDAA